MLGKVYKLWVHSPLIGRELHHYEPNLFMYPYFQDSVILCSLTIYHMILINQIFHKEFIQQPNRKKNRR